MILTEALINEALEGITRIECVSMIEGARVFVRWDLCKVEAQIQDEGRTLKIFYRNK